MNYTEKNSKIIDSWVNDDWEWSREISHADFLKAKNHEKGIFLTPLKDVPESWIDDIKGKKVLGLASAGGQQMPVLVARGAICTVMDYSSAMLEKEKIVSERENYKIDIVKADMSKKFPFADNTFDFIVNPVSNIYIENLDNFWSECYRVLKPGGKLMAGLDNGWNFVLDEFEENTCWSLPFNTLTHPDKDKICKEDGFQFSHDISEQIGGQIKAGFTILDIFSDSNNSGKMSKLNAPFYNVTLSIKK